MSLLSTYKAASFDESGSKLTLKEVELQQPGSGFILAKVLACGICHSDSWVQQGRFGDLFPRVPGHELVGDVVAVGDGVTSVKVGERVGGAWHGGKSHWTLKILLTFGLMCYDRTRWNMSFLPDWIIPTL